MPITRLEEKGRPITRSTARVTWDTSDSEATVTHGKIMRLDPRGYGNTRHGFGPEVTITTQA